jgi:hypothetical protein
MVIPPENAMVPVTVDFFLSRNRDVNAAKSFLRSAMKNTRVPTKITLDAYAASHRAVREMKEDGELPCRVNVRSSQYLNNLVEQDHRRVKQRIRSMPSSSLRLIVRRLRTRSSIWLMNACDPGAAHLFVRACYITAHNRRGRAWPDVALTGSAFWSGDPPPTDPERITEQTRRAEAQILISSRYVAKTRRWTSSTASSGTPIRAVRVSHRFGSLVRTRTYNPSVNRGYFGILGVFQK